MPLPTAGQSLLALHLATLLFGGTALFSRALPLPALDMTTWRSLIAGLALVWLARLKWKVTLGIGREAWLWLGVAGVLMAVHWVTYFHAMQVSSVATGMLALFTYPVLLVLLEPLFERTRIQLGDLFAALLVLAGVWLLVPGGPSASSGVLWGVFSGLLFALRNLLVRYKLRHLNPLLSMGLQALIVVAVTLPFVSDAALDAPPATGLWMLLLALVFTATPHTLMTFALAGLKARSVGLISCLQPVYGTLLAWLILNERPGLWTLAGGALIVAAAALESVKKR
ncbi:Threonine/homoserine efflux transporter RhtA [Modicisalibacter muralis]|uniref:Threonine/homoserine efflux transporter RhtA n=1 Tax=Modicisalibacter muralis TaxID=119000 RepID=A0A1G9MQ17_9GAMM|nr:DMT family transporter [Halomonas muralis]SDL76358.1 Threonine/homoserine efflux transporter RhtA [Halomonas muralis]